MTNRNITNITWPKNRVLSLDVMRGLIMIFLGGESSRLYQSIRNLNPTGAYKEAVDFFFEHHPWNGLHVWDLIQPAFMLMAGSSLFLSYHFKTLNGISWEQNLRHVVIRCFKLFLLGTGIHCVNSGRLVWELWNVLTQLSFTTLVALPHHQEEHEVPADLFVAANYSNGNIIQVY